MKVHRLNDLPDRLKKKARIVITTHLNPDGDAMGSSLGWAGYLKGKGHEVQVVVPNTPPPFLLWLPGYSEVLAADRDKAKSEAAFQAAEIIFCLDFNGINRAGEDIGQWIEASSARKVVIDHHREPENWPDDIYSDTEKGSTAEMIYDLICLDNGLEDLTVDIATCLYVGIITDSGSFRYSSTTADTHRAAAQLLESGVDPAPIHEAIYDSSTASRLQLLGHMLVQMEVLEDDGVAMLYLDSETMGKYGYKKGDSEGFVNYGLSINSVRVAAFFRQDEDVTKCSFRSKGDTDVNTLARTFFNGGGHLNAAGGLYHGTPKEAMARLTEIIRNKEWQQ